MQPCRLRSQRVDAQFLEEGGRVRRVSERGFLFERGLGLREIGSAGPEPSNRGQCVVRPRWKSQSVPLSAKMARRCLSRRVRRTGRDHPALSSIKCFSMASQPFSASAKVRNGDPPTLTAAPLKWMGRQEAAKPGRPRSPGPRLLSLLITNEKLPLLALQISNSLTGLWMRWKCRVICIHTPRLQWRPDTIRTLRACNFRVFRSAPISINPPVFRKCDAKRQGCDVEKMSSPPSSGRIKP